MEEEDNGEGGVGAGAGRGVDVGVPVVGGGDGERAGEGGEADCRHLDVFSYLRVWKLCLWLMDIWI